jgi:hypothetical protein
MESLSRRTELALGVLLLTLAAGMSAAEWCRYQLRKTGVPYRR